MRFTVKAKLASAFGAIIILSAITGGVAYVKLNDLAASSRDPGEPGRSHRCGERYGRAGPVSGPGGEEPDPSVGRRRHRQVCRTIKKLRGRRSQIRDEIVSPDQRTGQGAHRQIRGAYEKMNKIEDEIDSLWHAEFERPSRAILEGRRPRRRQGLQRRSRRGARQARTCGVVGRSAQGACSPGRRQNALGEDRQASERRLRRQRRRRTEQERRSVQGSTRRRGERRATGDGRRRRRSAISTTDLTAGIDKS